MEEGAKGDDITVISTTIEPVPSIDPNEKLTESGTLHQGAPDPIHGGDAEMERLLAKMLEGVIIQCDIRVQAVFRSQDEVAAQMARLHEAIEQFNTFSAYPSLSQYASRLNAMRSQLQNIQTSLLATQKRLVRLHADVSQVSGEPGAPLPVSLPFSKTGSLADAAADRLSSLFKKSIGALRQPDGPGPENSQSSAGSVTSEKEKSSQ